MMLMRQTLSRVALTPQLVRRISTVDTGVIDNFHIVPTGDSDVGHQSRISFLTKDMNESKLIGVRGLSSVGFRLYDGNFVYGPIAVFPKTVMSWRVLTPADITPESLELFFLLQPKIDVLVLGVGDREDLDSVRHRVAPVTTRHKIGLEIMTTEAAIPTFNFLNSECRYVGAALYPPRNLVVTERQNRDAMNYLRPYDQLDEHPFFGAVEANLSVPAVDIVKRIWGSHQPHIVEEVLKLNAKSRQEKADHLIGAKERADKPARLGDRKSESPPKKLDDK